MAKVLQNVVGYVEEDSLLEYQSLHLLPGYTLTTFSYQNAPDSWVTVVFDDTHHEYSINTYQFGLVTVK